MDNITLVKTSLQYYDDNTEKYSNLLRNASYIKFIESDNNIDHNIIVYYDDDKNEFFRSRYEIMGVYYSSTHTWTWGWAIPSLKKKHTNIIRNIWNYGASIDDITSRYLKTQLITSRFRVADEIQLDIHSSIASYLSKNPMIYKYYFYIDTNNETTDLVKIHNNEAGQYTTHFMFLLDYKNIKNNNINNECSD